MSDVTRPTGGTPAERGPQTPDARGETALGTGPAHDGTAAPGTGPAHDGTAPGARPAHDGTAAPGARTVHGETAREARPGHAGEEEPLGARSEHGAGVREEAAPHLRTSGSGVAGTERTTQAPPPGPGTPLLPREESDKYGERLHHAVSGFVDDPRRAVEEADRVLEEIAARFTDAVTRRRRTLRGSWQAAEADSKPTTADTEQLRLALRDYRELSDRLMHL
ncbi:hypothetical protein ABZ397_04465 [Streptomyces sp. NPDC005876]|uniref:hypothetical protein n=1 Tax=Streptomyces sp. NPDC005876 TaxID=3157076 RepID=UPI0033D732CB